MSAKNLSQSQRVLLMLCFPILLTAIDSCAPAPTFAPAATPIPTAITKPEPTLTPTASMTATPAATATPVPTATPIASVLIELAKKQGLDLNEYEVKTSSKIDLVYSTPTITVYLRPLDPTKSDRAFYLSPDSKSLIEVKGIPTDAKNISLDSEVGQVSYTSKYGTKFWFDPYSEMFLNVSGQYFIDIDPAKQPEIINQWIENLQIENRSTFKIVSDYEGLPGIGRTLPQIEFKFEGGNPVEDPKSFIKLALKNNLPKYTKPDTLPPQMHDVDKLFTNINHVANLLRIKKIVLTDDVFPRNDPSTNKPAALGWGMKVIYEKNDAVLYANPKFLYFYHIFTIGAYNRSSSEYLPTILVDNLVLQATINSSKLIVDSGKYASSCPISPSDAILPPFYYQRTLFYDRNISKLYKSYDNERTQLINAYDTRKTILTSCSKE